MKKEITRQEYLQLLGLKALALNHSRTMRELRTTVSELLSIEEGELEDDEVQELIWDDKMDVDTLLKTRLNIPVPPAQTKRPFVEPTMEELSADQLPPRKPE